jgi:hypothetical protein
MCDVNVCCVRSKYACSKIVVNLLWRKIVKDGLLLFLRIPMTRNIARRFGICRSEVTWQVNTEQRSIYFLGESSRLYV